MRIRNETDLLILLASVVAAVNLMWWGLNAKTPNGKTPVRIIKLKPKCDVDGCQGTYAYQGANGLFWYYSFNFQPIHSNSPYAIFGRSLPSSGVWNRSMTAPSRSEFEEEESIGIEVSPNGNPVSESINGGSD